MVFISIWVLRVFFLSAPSGTVVGVWGVSVNLKPVKSFPVLFSTSSIRVMRSPKAFAVAGLSCLKVISMGLSSFKVFFTVRIPCFRPALIPLKSMLVIAGESHTTVQPVGRSLSISFFSSALAAPALIARLVKPTIAAAAIIDNFFVVVLGTVFMVKSPGNYG